MSTLSLPDTLPAQPLHLATAAPAAPLTIAVLLTSHNRRDTTLACLRALHAQFLPETVRLSIFLVDDASSDGTPEAVREAYRSVNVIPGSGSLFYTGGMRTALAAARADDPEFFLLLNDDTTLHPTALQHLLRISEKVGRTDDIPSILVGATLDPQTGDVSYSGLVRHSRRRPLQFDRLAPSMAVLPCDTFNANCVLVPRRVVDKIGNLDPAFSHAMGDLDFGLRARDFGFNCFLAPKPVGTCPKNRQPGAWTDPSAPLSRRWQHLFSVKGLPPRQWLAFARRHAGPLWPVHFASPYVHLAIDTLLSPFTRSVR